MIDAYIGIGGNLGDRLDHFCQALEAIDELPGTHVAFVSHVYESEPWGVEHQPPFANAVALVRTNLLADQLLALLKDVEHDLGREPASRFGPRVIDLDILLFGDEEWTSDELTIPHPRMAEREFVIRPLLDLGQDTRYPNGDAVTDEHVCVGRIIGELGAVPGFEDRLPLAEPKKPERPSLSDVPPELLRAMPAMPVTDAVSTPVEGWEPIGKASTQYSRFTTDVDLLLAEAVLADAGIECEFYPNRPGEGPLNPWGMPQTVRLMVPARRRDEAERLVAEAMRASPADPGPEEPGPSK
jgi:2-amino-4-hydroxy-6-hydroxymethyldihydropteridine diphosphokinase